MAVVVGRVQRSVRNEIGATAAAHHALAGLGEDISAAADLLDEAVAQAAALRASVALAAESRQTAH